MIRYLIEENILFNCGLSTFVERRISKRLTPNAWAQTTLGSADELEI
jgi:hypothetical protein